MLVDSHSRHNISHFHHTHNIGAMIRILYKLWAVWLLNLFACMYGIVSIKKTYNSRELSVVGCVDLSSKERHRQVCDIKEAYMV